MGSRFRTIPVVMQSSRKYLHFKTGMLCGLWLVVTILTSSDGISWTKQKINTKQTIYGVAYGNGMWIIGDSAGRLFTSRNGTSWTINEEASKLLGSINDIAYGNGMWVGVGNSGAIFTSSNGISWKKQSSGTTSGLWRISYYSGTWFASGGLGIFESNDAINWIQQYNGGEIRKVACSNGIAVAVGVRGTILTSNISNIKDFIKQLHSLEQKHLIATEKAADNKALKEAEENKKNAIEEANQQFEERRKEIVQEILHKPLVVPLLCFFQDIPLLLVKIAPLLPTPTHIPLP